MNKNTEGLWMHQVLPTTYLCIHDFVKKILIYTYLIFFPSFFRKLVGGVINDPPIDSSGDIQKFCMNLSQLCVQNGVEIRKNAEVKEILVDKST